MGISVPIDMAAPIARPTALLMSRLTTDISTKQKQGRFIGSTIKQAKKS